jgi:hypothetical protein
LASQRCEAHYLQKFLKEKMNIMNLQALQVKAGHEGHAAEHLEFLSPESNVLIFEKIDMLCSDHPVTEDEYDNYLEANRDQTELAQMILKVANQPEHPSWISLSADCKDSLGMSFIMFIRSDNGRFRLEDFTPFVPVTRERLESRNESKEVGCV